MGPTVYLVTNRKAKIHVINILHEIRYFFGELPECICHKYNKNCTVSLNICAMTSFKLMLGIACKYLMSKKKDIGIYKSLFLTSLTLF